MKKTAITIICGIFLIFSAACSGTDGGAKITFDLKDKKGGFEPKSALLQVFEDNRNLVIANYDLDAKDPASAFKNEIKSAEQYRLSILLFDLEAGKNETITPSEYTDDLNKSGNEKTIASAMLYYFADGKEQLQNIDSKGAETKNGFVKFTEVSGDTVVGELDIRDGEGRSVKGTFTAKIVKN